MAVAFNSESAKPELNQYWYSQKTIERLLAEATHHATRCAFLSTPSLYFALGKSDETLTESQRDGDEKGNASSIARANANADREAAHARAVALRKHSKLFEFDRQWSSDPGFVFYDFSKPDQIPVQYLNYFDYVIVDPPFVTKDVWERYVETIRLIIKRDPAADEAQQQHGTGYIRDCLGGGKVLFTTILENHTMLEGLINGPLFIPRFCPYVKGLVYQYVCFTNYEATQLQVANPEVSENDAECQTLWAAIGMANDIRQSETAFALQMEQRDRDGETPLPALGHEQIVAGVATSTLAWGYVPEGLSEYPEGQTASTVVAAAATYEETDPAVYGPVYVAALALRGKLDDFKGRIDAVQKLMDAQMKLRHQRVKLSKEHQQAKGASTIVNGQVADYEGAIASASADIEQSESARQAHLNGMADLARSIVADEQQLSALKHDAAKNEGATTALVTKPVSVTVSYEAAMEECVIAYRKIEAKKMPLQELAADATRKYKSPIFTRMKELLQEMKDIKKAHKAAQTAA